VLLLAVLVVLLGEWIDLLGVVAFAAIVEAVRRLVTRRRRTTAA